MPVPPLTAAQSNIVAQGAQLLDSGRPREAAEAVAELVAEGCQHPDPLMIYSAACEQLGLAHDAVGSCQAALQASPERADLWASLGRLLHQQGQHADGAGLLEQAVALDPANPTHWYNLGLAAAAASQPERACEAFRKATDLKPDWAMAWGGLGHALERSGDLDGAEVSLRRALALDPALDSARHSLVVTLRRLSEAAEALAVAAAARHVETRLVAAQALADTGSPEAPDLYRQLLRERPDQLSGHDAFARLMPQLGRPEESLDTYREAIASAPTLELYLSALASARDLGLHEAMSDWVEQARGRFGDLPDLAVFEALALARRGDDPAAIAILEPLAMAGRSELLNHCAYLRLRGGDIDRAEEHALAATQADFTDQLAWGCLTLVWRLKDNPSAQWLADYDRFVLPIVLDPPQGFASIRQFMAELAGELHGLHNTGHHPADQSLRNGTQTRGYLFDRRSPLIRSLASGIQRQVRVALADLPKDPTHPFLGRNTGNPAFLGSWSVRLRSGGFHIGHIHNQGWLSSALYVELPEGMALAEPGSVSPGALQFGVPPAELNIDVEPRRIEQPQIGRLVVFPSYFWHGTLPFEGDAPRLTIAFDMAPG